VDGQVTGPNSAGGGIENGGFEDGGEFADVAGPGVLQEAGQGAGAEDRGGLLVMAADAVDEGLGDWGDVFAMLTEGGEWRIVRR
jgi:hypothetical protein